MTTFTNNKQSKSPFTTIVLAGLVAGTLDASAAMIQYMINSNGGNPLKVWRYVASGVLGQQTAAKDLATMAVIGLIFHFIIAFCFTLFFFFIFSKIKFLWRNLVVTGLVYGIFVWLVMNVIVVPLSNISAKGKLWTIITNTEGKRNAILQLPLDPAKMIIGILIIMFCVGLPLSLIIGGYYKKRENVTGR